MPNNSNNTNYKYLNLRAKLTSKIGKIMTYMDSFPAELQAVAILTFQGRFYPFIIDKDDPDFREIAIQCAAECESWAASIREYAEIEERTDSKQTHVLLNSIAEDNVRFPSNQKQPSLSVPDRKELPQENSEAAEIGRGDNLMEFMGLDSL